MSTEIDTLFDALIRDISSLQAALMSEAPVEVEPVGESIQVIFARLNSLELQERIAYQGRLQELQDALGAFQDALCARRDALRAHIGGLQQSRSANAAYRTSEARDNYKPEE